MRLAFQTTSIFLSAGKRGKDFNCQKREEIKKNHKLAWYKMDMLNENSIATMEAMVFRKNQYFVDQVE